MSEPHDKSNFLIEVTSEQLDELRKVYQYADEECYVELHYSPYWKRLTEVEEQPK